jgi:hypothetical protein
MVDVNQREPTLACNIPVNYDQSGMPLLSDPAVGNSFLPIWVLLSGNRNWFTNSMTTCSFFHHISPPMTICKLWKWSVPVTIINNFPITTSKPSKFCANIMDTCSSCPWKVVKNSNQPSILEPLCHMWVIFK